MTTNQPTIQATIIPKSEGDKGRSAVEAIGIGSLGLIALGGGLYLARRSIMKNDEVRNFYDNDELNYTPLGYIPPEINKVTPILQENK